MMATVFGVLAVEFGGMEAVAREKKMWEEKKL